MSWGRRAWEIVRAADGRQAGLPADQANFVGVAVPSTANTAPPQRQSSRKPEIKTPTPTRLREGINRRRTSRLAETLFLRRSSSSPARCPARSSSDDDAPDSRDDDDDAADPACLQRHRIEAVALTSLEERGSRSSHTNGKISPRQLGLRSLDNTSRSPPGSESLPEIYTLIDAPGSPSARIPLANSENGTVQGAVATWWTRKSLPTRRQVATAPCTVPIRQRYQPVGCSVNCCRHLWTMTTLTCLQL